MTTFEKDCRLVRQGIVNNAPNMFREPEGSLTEPYLDPGGPYSKNLWDWDSYWATVALFRLTRDPNMDKKIAADFSAVQITYRPRKASVAGPSL